MADFSYVFNAHPTHIEAKYKEFKSNPASVEDGWRSFFQGFDFASNGNGHSSNISDKDFGVLKIIHGFRSRGHLLSTTNPIRKRRDRAPHLSLSDYGLSEADLDQRFEAGKEIGLNNATLREIIKRLQSIYGGNIGYEYAYIENTEKRNWLKAKIENQPNSEDYALDINTKRRILKNLTDAAIFEKFLHTKYVGQKRFSLEGGETTIAALDAIIHTAAENGVEEVVMGMAHRGRLNVLANIMGKTYEHIFNEFEGNSVPDLSFGDGDVKYHLGYSSLVKTDAGKEIHLKLAPNPSHLECVNPVVEGFARAKADILYKSDYDKILPILIHGDAAIAGQGVVYETVQMSQLEGYYTGGTIHFVINNQVGFTTDFDDARSSTYSTGVASLVQAPVFHVNGDDPEAVVYAVQLATEYRQKFNNDVFIDMVCYRKHGHNEGDDPKFTQPEMYEFISGHKNPREIYIEELKAKGVVTEERAEQIEKDFWDLLQDKLSQVKEKPLPYEYQEPELEWKKLKKKVTEADYFKTPKTGITLKKVDQILAHLQTIPEGFTPLSKVNRLLKNSQKLIDKGQLDWAMAELTAYASLLLEGKNVRMSGQDVRRGTFSHRHAVLRDTKDYSQFNRLSNISKEQGEFRIYNSFLSEFAVMGFEYGYSLATPRDLVIWEAQFGDFYNGAQTIIDQFLTAAESKWQRMSGLTLLLPHGYEGQGPEHSSARLERFLQQCAELNMTVANITSPANFFHALRRQIAWNFRKPLVVMSPKSIFRHPLCISDKADFKTGTSFQEVIDDPKATKSAKKVIFCTGKIYFDILQERESMKDKSTAIVRIEQLYPFPEKQVQAIFKKYNKAKYLWVQEEPENMGAWQYLLRYWRLVDIDVISRKASASPATGFKKVHEAQQKEIISKALKG